MVMNHKVWALFLHSLKRTSSNGKQHETEIPTKNCRKCFYFFIFINLIFMSNIKIGIR